jgi:acetylornithine deacetylase/succinyl-diaminopimelate desuccinylase-like protein
MTTRAKKKSEPTTEVLQRSEPNYSPPDHELFQIVGRAVTEVRGAAPALNIGAPATDARVFRRVGIPVAVFGPRPYNLGAADEYITVEDYLDTARVHALSALDYLSPKGRSGETGLGSG